jgi:hypothetical protein
LNAVIAAFKAAVHAAAALAQAIVKGDWKAIGRMILEATLKLLGIDPATFYAFIGKVEDQIEKIVEDPGTFVHGLVEAVKGGFQKFSHNFWDHLKGGLLDWLFGAFSGTGLVMPKAFGIVGIFELVTQILGFTWDKIRGRAVNIIGEKNVERIEWVAHQIQDFMRVGIGGLWMHLKDDMSNLWDVVVGGIKDWLIYKVVQQAILKLATMWNPVGAIVQLLQTAWNIYNWVKENTKRIMSLIDAVVGSVGEIVAKMIGKAIGWIEQALARTIPAAISFLADLLGLGGITDKIREIIAKVQSMIWSAIEKLIKKVVGWFKGGKDKDKKDEKQDKEPDQRTPEQKQADLDRAVAEAKALGGQKDLTESQLQAQLAKIKDKYRLTELKATPDSKGGEFQVHAAVNPQCTFELVLETKAAKQIEEAARPKIERLTRKNTFDDVKQILNAALKEVLPNEKHAYLRYGAPGADGEVSVALIGLGGHTPTPIGSIWDREKLYLEIDRKGNQILYSNKANGKEFVHDKKGQYVQRRIVRNLSDADIKQRKKTKTIEPTGPSATWDAQEHVMGNKPSQYISATKQPDGQIKNPQGETFESFKIGGKVSIDLFWIDPQKIMDLSTWTGQQEWGLSNPQTEKTKQALEDVKRTQEVLIEGTIPAEAIEEL